MVATFKYKELPGKKGSNHKCPAIEVIFQGKSKFAQKIVALIDSGADLSVIPLDLAKFLNVDLSMNESISHGIGGKVKSKRSKIKVSVNGDRRKYTFEIPIEVILEGNPPVILGRQGFFDKFEITLIEAEQKIKLKKYSKRKY